MCGICGLVSARPIQPGLTPVMQAVNQALFHRGPDGSGEFRDSHVHLAMRRLSIIDLNGGWQPLYNEDKTIALVCNGEVYNHVELREMLAAKGHRFHTHSDCEMLAHLYEEYGLDFVQHLRGMYGFALWDSKKRRLIVGRDRMGEKPIYLLERETPDGPQIVFASEMKALIASGMVKFELDPVAVNEFMHYSYVPEPRTAIKGVRKLPAGHILIIDVDPWKVQQVCYWRMLDAPPVTGNPAKLIREELDRVSELIVRSDVPVGVALSGGLDSSAIAALAASKYPGTMHAFSVGYPGRPRQDERAMAKVLADHLKMPFHEIEISETDLVDTFAERQFFRDDPIADISGNGYYAVSKIARQHRVPVLLQGHGLDELDWGYHWAREAARLSILKNDGRLSVLSELRKLLPDGFARNDLLRYAMMMGGKLHGWNRILPDMHARPEQLLCYDLENVYKQGQYAARHLYTQRFRKLLAGTDASDILCVPRPWQDVPNLITKLQCDIYLLENGIAQGDRLSMASSIELRLPLVDYKLVELFVGLRKSYPDHELGHKAWFKEAVKDVLPEWVMNRPKRGFTPPVKNWTKAMRDRYAKALEDGYLVQSGFFEQRVVRTMTSAESRFSAWPPNFYKALVLEFWCREMSARCTNSRAVLGMESTAQLDPLGVAATV
ncbi:MAG: asparagine synthase (glutamine-hydrolyzing) [Planctomycetota bacterium]|nr:asparagine synthase (glutamine-hydrolyzing) [Planctomycetota bacterium]